MLLIGVALVVAAAGSGSFSSVTLKSSALSATLDSVHGLVSVQAPNSPLHGFVPGTDGWRVDLSAYNVTHGGDVVSLTPAACKLGSFEPAAPASATYVYACAAHRVEVEYELKGSWAFVRKSVRVCQTAAGSAT